MAEWGRKEYSKPWPSQVRVWTLSSVPLTAIVFASLLTWQYERSWTETERVYLAAYVRSGTLGRASATLASKYTLLEGVTGKGQKRLLIGNEIEPLPDDSEGRPGYRLTEEGAKNGLARLTWVTAERFKGDGLSVSPPSSRPLKPQM